MQRGRGQGRGRNSHPARSTSARGSRSTSRRPNSQTRSRNSSLRRSARLAQLLDGELLNGDVEPSPTNGSMADVARPRALGNRTVRSRHHSSRTPGRSRGGRHSIAPEDIRYAMDIVLQPPATARAGQALNGSIIVRLRTTNTNPDEAIMDSSNLFAIASLVPGPGTTYSADPAVLNTLLAGGRRFDSIRPFSDDAADGVIGSMELDDPQGVGYMMFPGLIIKQAGSYRIRIALVRSDPNYPSPSGGVTVQVVDSNPIMVQGSGASSPTAYNGKYLVASY